MSIKRIAAACIFPLALAAAGAAQANAVYTVSLDTSAISGAAGYGIAFSFQDGGDLNNNTVTLSGFDFGGGSSGGNPATVGSGVSGSLESPPVIFNDADFSSLFTEGFTPGNKLSFTLDFTTNVDAVTPDFFGFSLLFMGAAIPTQDDTLGDNLLYVEFDSSNPAPKAFDTDPNNPSNGLVELKAPTASPGTPPVPAPEPGSLFLLGLGFAGLLGMRRRRL